MKIVTTLIVLLAMAVGFNMYSSFEERDRLETALVLLDERINSNVTTIEEIEEYMVDSTIDFENMQHIMMDNISGVAKSLEKHKHKPVYIDKPEVPAVKIVPKQEPVKEQPILARTYDPETKLHVPSFPPVIPKCPKTNNKLGNFIEDVSLRRDYKFIVTYDIVNNSVSNITFDKKIPSKLKSSMIQYINSFQARGDVTNCKLSIKVLEN